LKKSFKHIKAILNIGVHQTTAKINATKTNHSSTYIRHASQEKRSNIECSQRLCHWWFHSVADELHDILKQEEFTVFKSSS